MGGLSCYSCTEFKGTARVPCPGKLLEERLKVSILFWVYFGFLGNSFFTKKNNLISGISLKPTLSSHCSVRFL